MSDKPVHRATIVVKLGVPEVEHDVCLTNVGLEEIEVEFAKLYGAPFRALNLLPENGTIPFGVLEATTILHIGLKGAGKPISRKAVQDFLSPMKPGDILTAAIKAVTAAFFDPPKKEEDPAEIAARLDAEAASLATPVKAL